MVIAQVKAGLFANTVLGLLVLARTNALQIELDGGRTKQPILNETKPPISKMRQNRRFRK